MTSMGSKNKGGKVSNKKPTWRAVFTQELSGSLLLFYLFFPAAEVAAKYTKAIWLYGLICIIALDVITKSAVMNPAVAVGLYFAGIIPARDMLVRIAAQLTAGAIAIPLLTHFSATAFAIPPTFVTTSLDAAIIELFLTATLMFFVLVLTKAKWYVVRVVTIACIIQSLVYVGAPYTGALMNPMLGVAWELRHMSVSLTTLNVYAIAPTLGAVLACDLFHSIFGRIDTSVSQSKKND